MTPPASGRRPGSPVGGSSRIRRHHVAAGAALCRWAIRLQPARLLPRRRLGPLVRARWWWCTSSGTYLWAVTTRHREIRFAVTSRHREIRRRGPAGRADGSVSGRGRRRRPEVHFSMVSLPRSAGRGARGGLDRPVCRAIPVRGRCLVPVRARRRPWRRDPPVAEARRWVFGVGEPLRVGGARCRMWGDARRGHGQRRGAARACSMALPRSTRSSPSWGTLRSSAYAI